MGKQETRQTNYLPLVKSVRMPLKIKRNTLDRRIIKTPEEARGIGIRMAKVATKKLKIRIDL